MKSKPVVHDSAISLGINAMVLTERTQNLPIIELHGRCIDESPRRRMKLDLIEEQREARHYILAYLLDNPDAGRHRRWNYGMVAAESKNKFETRIVSEAIARLVAENLIVEYRGPRHASFTRSNPTGGNVQNIQTMLSNGDRT